MTFTLHQKLRSISGNPNEHIVEWYRVAQGLRIGRTFLAGSMLVCLGGLLCALAFHHPTSSLATRRVLLLAGVLLVMAGPLSTIARLLVLMQEELYIALCSDGIALCEQDDLRFLPWEQLMSASYDQDQQLLSLELRDAETLAIRGALQTIASKDIAKRINTVRTKSLWGTLGTE